ncbi:phosphopantetheine-binding protein [Streptomyces sp. NBC_00280]|uniref:phosphopantetheine-binding protein n=1 Tax=Streptomyces sp. NBC_00280 TaxID=2975699 RepID=UPI00352F4250
MLGVPVGPDDDCFELGGDSPFAVRIGAALRARALPSPRLRELYRHPTARGTAASLGAPDSPRAGTAEGFAHSGALRSDE